METVKCRARRYEVYRPAKPYFDLVRGALGDLVEGEHFFDVVAEDIVYEVLYYIAGWPRIVRGRAELMSLFRGYCDNIELASADKLIVRKTDDGRVVVIEYEVHGTILATGVKYDNRFCSIIVRDFPVFNPDGSRDIAGLRIPLFDGKRCGRQFSRIAVVPFVSFARKACPRRNRPLSKP